MGLTADWRWQRNESVTLETDQQKIYKLKNQKKDWSKIKRTSETCGREQANGLIYAFILWGWCNLDSKTEKGR